jgi:hypothetical protein
MPNYPTHARWGRIGAVFAALAVGGGVFWLSGSPRLAAGGAAGAGAATFVGSIFPDVDHHRSIPRRRATRALQVLVVFGMVSLAALNFELLVESTEGFASEQLDGQVPPELLAGGGVALAALVATGLVDPLVGAVTGPHRGWTHSVPALVVLTAAVVGAVVVLTDGVTGVRQAAAGLVASTFLFGCLIHLGLDGELT